MNRRGGHSIHPTQKPVDLLERAIRTHTKPGAVVCDFFAGSGSTGVAALKAGRRYILIEQSASYHEKGLAWLEEAEQAGHKVERLIRIPRADQVERGAFVVISGKQYGIAQTQIIKDTLPECTDLTLEQPELLLDFDDTEVGGGGRF